MIIIDENLGRCRPTSSPVMIDTIMRRSGHVHYTGKDTLDFLRRHNFVPADTPWTVDSSSLRAANTTQQRRCAVAMRPAATVNEVTCLSWRHIDRPTSLANIIGRCWRSTIRQTLQSVMRLIIDDLRCWLAYRSSSTLTRVVLYIVSQR